jgi:hypothetical protein
MRGPGRSGHCPSGRPGRPHRGRPQPADPAGDERQRPPDDEWLHPRVHGPVRDPPALRPPRHPDRPGVDLGRCSATSRPNGHTCCASATPRPCAPSSRWSASTTTPCGCTPASATSPPDDEHQGRGPAIRKARQAGLEQARLRRIAYHRANPIPDPTVHPEHDPSEEPGDVGESIRDPCRELRNRSCRSTTTTACGETTRRPSRSSPGWPASATRWNSLDCHADRRFLDAAAGSDDDGQLPSGWTARPLDRRFGAPLD